MTVCQINRRDRTNGMDRSRVDREYRDLPTKHLVLGAEADFEYFKQNDSQTVMGVYPAGANQIGNFFITSSIDADWLFTGSVGLQIIGCSMAPAAWPSPS
jgi:hypothetical protein